MKKSLRIIAALLFAAAAQAGQKVEVIKAQFGLVCQSESGQLSFMPSTAVPLVVGQVYGWVIHLETDRPIVHWREEFTLPKAPVRWGQPEDIPSSLSRDRKVSVLENDAPLEAGGVIFNSWAVAAGDPTGKYKIRVVIDQAVERTFEFDVLEPAQSPNLPCTPPGAQSAALDGGRRG